MSHQDWLVANVLMYSFYIGTCTISVHRSAQEVFRRASVIQVERSESAPVMPVAEFCRQEPM